jgi:two-component system, NarL family, capsular synthesis sensor histidine kinase RcsC
VTRMGPHRPAARGDGVLEVTEFSHAAFRAALELAASGQASGAASLEEAADPHLFTPDPVLRGLRVLVAEDNPLNQTLITEQLTALGCLPSVVGDGRQALAALPQTNFDIVLTDIHMPIMDGYALVSALRVAFPDLPVLAYSAVTGFGSARDWRARGFTEYIAKPASLSQLQDVLLRVGVRAAMTGGGAGAEPSEAAVPPDEHDGLDPEDKARYLSLLKHHMRTDLPRLVGIIERHDADALRNWAHSSGGAFLVVREMGLAAQCRELLRLSDQSGDWNTPIEQRAIALHEALRAQFGIDEASLQ